MCCYCVQVLRCVVIVYGVDHVLSLCVGVDMGGHCVQVLKCAVYKC